MSAKFGNDLRLFVQSTTPGTYNEIKGQRDVQQSRTASTIDIGDKNSAPYGKTAPGNVEYSITLNGVVDLPDATGLERLNTLFIAQTAEKIQLRDKPFSTDDVVFEGLVYVQALTISGSRDSERTYDVTFSLAAAPDVDLLVPAP